MKKNAETSVNESTTTQPTIFVPLARTTLNTFVEVLLINRILLKQQTNKQNILSNVSEKQKKVFSLLSSDGIVKYLSEHYKDSDCNIIEKIFENIVMKNYINEYTNETTYKTKNIDIEANENKFFTSLLNQKDLFCQIFQFLSIDDLNNCSIVNFIWLIHSFNINSLYYLPFDQIHKWEFDKMHKQKIETKAIGLSLRVWQRFINIRRIDFESGKKIREFFIPSEHFLKHFKTLQKIDNVNFKDLVDHHLPILEALEHISSKIKYFCVTCVPWSGISRNGLPVLKLPNAREVKLSDIQLPVIISNKCETLSLSLITLNPKLDIYETFINNCDFTGVKRLVVDDISFGIDDKNTKRSMLALYATPNKVVSSNDDASKKKTCKLFASKFGAIEQFKTSNRKNDTVIFLTELSKKKDYDGSSKMSADISFDLLSGSLLIEENTDKVLNDYTQIIDLIINNKINLVAAKISLDSSSAKVNEKLFKTKGIFRNTEILKLFGYSSYSWLEPFVAVVFGKQDSKNGNNNNIDNNKNDNCSGDINNDNQVNDRLTTETIEFCNLMRFDCTLTFADAEMVDWERIVQMLQCSFNFGKKNDNCNYMFWNLKLNMRWPRRYSNNNNNNNNDNGTLIAIFDHLKNIWQVVNEKFIKKGKMIDINIKMNKYHLLQADQLSMKQQLLTEEKQMITMYQKYGKAHFFAQFGDLAFEKDEKKVLNNNGESKYSVQDKIANRNKYCEAMVVPQAWCYWRKKSIPSDGLKAELIMEFCVKNARVVSHKFYE